MTVIFTADLHLNEKPQDEYRWHLFDWLIKHHKADELVLGGDLTDAKDRHSAKLTNRMYRVMMELQDRYKVIWLKGNHDYYDPDHPFFEFIGNQSDIIFVKQPQQIQLSIGTALFVPAGSDWSQFDWKGPGYKKIEFIFTHATFSGAEAENGSLLTGVDPQVLKGFKGFVYSGDIHVPQKLFRGAVTYCGAPYHCHFGDSFNPRLLLLDKATELNLHYPAPRKLTCRITHPDQLLDEGIARGDHIKVKVLLRRAQYGEWKRYKQAIHEYAHQNKWLLFGADPVPVDDDTGRQSTVDADHPEDVSKRPVELVEDYAKAHKASKYITDIGKELIA